MVLFLMDITTLDAIFLTLKIRKKKTYDQIDSREIYYCLEGKSSKCPLK